MSKKPKPAAKGAAKGAGKPAAKGAEKPAAKGSDSAENAPEETNGPRPGRVTAAAALAALEGLALIVAGIYFVIRGATGEPDDRAQAITGGLTLAALGMIPLLAGRGLFAQRSWSRGPAIITQIMALPVAWQLLQADSAMIPAGIVLAVVAVTVLVLLIHPATTRALGIRGPGQAD
ncbi:hypothetical protein [Streptomyces sp. NA04227]|uniref:hypothetical protein n=1 Tax=Streptomyces sp. NA04227 TaxID=2742136 RepID=UPI0020CA8BD8|nr:hypothetical protein [Streptomyces sp. NA04227]